MPVVSPFDMLNMKAMHSCLQHFKIGLNPAVLQNSIVLANARCLYEFFALGCLWHGRLLKQATSHCSRIAANVWQVLSQMS